MKEKQSEDRYLCIRTHGTIKIRLIIVWKFHVVVRERVYVTNMNTGVKKVDNGSYPIDDYMRVPIDRTGWEKLRLIIHNPEEGSYLGRTPSNWGIYTYISTFQSNFALFDLQTHGHRRYF